MRPDVAATREYLLGLQESLCAALEAEDGSARFGRDAWERPGGGGGSGRNKFHKAMTSEPSLRRVTMT